MHVYDYKDNSGNISGLFLLEKSDMVPDDAGNPDTRAALEKSIGNAILNIAEIKNKTFMYTKILSYDVQDDGAIMVNFEAAAKPEVKLGLYRGVTVADCSDEREFADKAVSAAAENIDAEVPAMIVDRELDNIVREKKAELLQSRKLNILTDLHKIVSACIDSFTTDYKKSDLWILTTETTDDYFSGPRPDLSMENMISAVANIFSKYGRITDESGKIDDAICSRIALSVNKRMEERDKLSGEELAEQIFEIYLKNENLKEDDWREQYRSDALQRTRENLLLDAVADEEDIRISDAALQAELQGLANEYEITVDQVREYVGEEAIRYNLRRDLARDLIAESAIRV